jgi:hypothetical protein
MPALLPPLVFLSSRDSTKSKEGKIPRKRIPAGNQSCQPELDTAKPSYSDSITGVHSQKFQKYPGDSGLGFTPVTFALETVNPGNWKIVVP